MEEAAAHSSGEEHGYMNDIDDDVDNDDDVDDKLTFSNKLNSCRSRFQHNSCNTFLFRC